MAHVSMPRGLTKPRVEFAAGRDGRTLVLSMRKEAALVGYVAMYEFEDLVADLTGADLGFYADLDGLELSRRMYKLARYITRSPRIADGITPKRAPARLDKRYDLLVAVFNHPHELYALQALAGWRDRCRVAVCYLCEAWQTRFPVYLIELLRSFDHVFVGVKGAADDVAGICGRPCTYLPMGVDTIRFCPYPSPPQRSIDVCGIGRRSSVTHQALIQWAEEKGLFYYYDTIQAVGRQGPGKYISFRVGNPREHRMLLSNLLKRSRYFIANRAWADQPAVTRGKDDIAARFYEGAAAGAIMLGEPPDGEDFRSQFAWPDAVVRTPFDAPRIAEVIAALDGDPARSAGIRRDAVVHSLLQHDWVYRLREILKVAGMAPSDRVLAREARLQALAEQARRTDAAA
jgi:hypothetical protein